MLYVNWIWCLIVCVAVQFMQKDSVKVRRIWGDFKSLQISELVVFIVVGMHEIDSLCQVHRQEDRLFGCHVVTGWETRCPSVGHQFTQKVSNV